MNEVIFAKVCARGSFIVCMFGADCSVEISLQIRTCKGLGNKNVTAENCDPAIFSKIYTFFTFSI